VQIAGGDAAMLGEAASAAEGLGADIIDINMGCPAKKVCNKAAAQRY
jgi:tRNA-dihydrouridine synthase B